MQHPIVILDIGNEYIKVAVATRDSLELLQSAAEGLSRRASVSIRGKQILFGLSASACSVVNASGYYHSLPHMCFGRTTTQYDCLLPFRVSETGASSVEITITIAGSKSKICADKGEKIIYKRALFCLIKRLLRTIRQTVEFQGVFLAHHDNMQPRCLLELRDMIEASSADPELTYRVVGMVGHQYCIARSYQQFLSEKNILMGQQSKPSVILALNLCCFHSVFTVFEASAENTTILHSAESSFGFRAIQLAVRDLLIKKYPRIAHRDPRSAAVLCSLIQACIESLWLKTTFVDVFDYEDECFDVQVTLKEFESLPCFAALRKDTADFRHSFESARHIHNTRAAVSIHKFIVVGGCFRASCIAEAIASVFPEVEQSHALGEDFAVVRGCGALARDIMFFGRSMLSPPSALSNTRLSNSGFVRLTVSFCGDKIWQQEEPFYLGFGTMLSLPQSTFSHCKLSSGALVFSVSNEYGEATLATFGAQLFSQGEGSRTLFAVLCGHVSMLPLASVTKQPVIVLLKQPCEETKGPAILSAKDYDEQHVSGFLMTQPPTDLLKSQYEELVSDFDIRIKYLTGNTKLECSQHFKDLQETFSQNLPYRTKLGVLESMSLILAEMEVAERSNRRST